MFVKVVSSWKLPYDTLSEMNLAEFYLALAGEYWENTVNDPDAKGGGQEVNTHEELMRLRHNSGIPVPQNSR